MRSFLSRGLPALIALIGSITLAACGPEVTTGRATPMTGGTVQNVAMAAPALAPQMLAGHWSIGRTQLDNPSINLTGFRVGSDLSASSAGTRERYHDQESAHWRVVGISGTKVQLRMVMSSTRMSCELVSSTEMGCEMNTDSGQFFRVRMFKARPFPTWASDRSVQGI